MIKLNVRNKKKQGIVLIICLTVNIFSLPQEHLDKKVIKVAWKSPLIADTQNYKQMYTVLQVRALVKIIMLWPIPVLCQNNLLLVNWIWQLLQLSKISFLRKMMYTILLKSKLMVSSQNSTLNPQNHQRSKIEGLGWRTVWCSRLLRSKFAATHDYHAKMIATYS